MFRISCKKICSFSVSYSKLLLQEWKRTVSSHPGTNGLGHSIHGIRRQAKQGLGRTKICFVSVILSFFFLLGTGYAVA